MPSSILIHLPHASVAIPSDLRTSFLLGDSELEAEILAMTDRFTDELFELANADRLVFPVSRLVTDPERFREDADEPMAAKGMGALYIRTRAGKPLRQIENREALLARYYDPHHCALEAWAETALAEHHRCLIIDSHSFPNRPHESDLNKREPRPDMCLGTDPAHTSESLLKTAVQALEAQGWSVEVDWPYSGTITPASRYGVDGRVNSIMIEVNRKLYMDEATGEKIGAFEATRARLCQALEIIADAWHKAP